MTGVYIEPAMPWSAPVADRVYSHTCGRDQFLYINDGYGVSCLKTLDAVEALPPTSSCRGMAPFPKIPEKPARASSFSQMLVDLRDAVQKEIGRGATEDRAAAAIKLLQYEQMQG